MCFGPALLAVVAMHVEHFMTLDPVACEANDSVEDVSRLMREKGVGSVVILEHGKVVGIVTDRQVATEAVARGLAPGSTPVAKIMTRDPATVTLEDTLFSVLDTLRSAGVVRRVPVVNASHELVGIVSISDLAVVAKSLMDALLLEDTRHALSEVKLHSGGKRVQKATRAPHRSLGATRAEFRAVRSSSVPTLPARSRGRPEG